MTTPLIQFDLAEFLKGVDDKVQQWTNAVDGAAKSIMRDADVDLKAATIKFSRPLSTTVERRSVGSFDLICDDKRYLWLNRGTESHPITAHTDMGMTFAWAKNRKKGQHIAKTTARSLRPGAGSGDTYKGGSSITTGVMSVVHPGIKPRNWSGILTRKYRSEAKGRVIMALRNLR